MKIKTTCKQNGMRDGHQSCFSWAIKHELKTYWMDLAIMQATKAVDAMGLAKWLVASAMYIVGRATTSITRVMAPIARNLCY
ncbi:hypothetical protein WN944_022297 [Citrus x changshan-huyou]|uniref:Uncharacterized protein n=1 Tax=Citrus x changshan-huyou TaxID=2935761 RepID=A0AAP0R0C8_9ROSI